MLTAMLSAAVMLFSEPDTLFAVDTISRYDSVVLLQDIRITGSKDKDFQINTPHPAVQVNKDYLENHFSGSLIQSLEDIPGVKAMNIGSSQSKPTIRGLGFNRMAVTENGIKHESQQWGEEHGLEIDQFAIDRAEILKGPAALMYGSDAIGGVINLYTNYVPAKDFEANIILTGRSNNEQNGIAARLGGKKNQFFFRTVLSANEYSDFRVPADSIQYYSYWIKLYKQRLRNTAGKNADADILLGYAGKNFRYDLKISDNFSKSGFFADAHGLEVRLSDIDYNHSIRDIDVPCQQVNHLKILSHGAWSENSYTVDINLAYQNNLRKEYSEPLPHGYMPQPDGTLEREFNKDTYTANLGVSIPLSGEHNLKTGINTEYQHNRTGGWGFIIPDFENLSSGAYLSDTWSVKENLIFIAGLRYDYAKTHIHAYRDWFYTPTDDGSMVYKQRSEEITRRFNACTYSLGVTYNTDDWIFKSNIGKSFRIPVAKELGADGINYHIFRYEKGNNKLSAEESYQLDLGINFSNSRFTAEFDPYVNYFPDYIYLNPTSYYTEGMQTYYYTQAEVFRYGFEFQCVYNILACLDAEFKAEYLHSEQLSGEKKGYNLPFAVPWSINTGIKYSFDKNGKGYVSFDVRTVGSQNDIVPPEKPTKGHCSVNMAAGKQFTAGTSCIKISLQVKNLLNSRFYDHTSYYRLMDIPEPGRNIAIMINWSL